MWDTARALPKPRGRGSDLFEPTVGQFHLGFSINLPGDLPFEYIRMFLLERFPNRVGA